MLRAAVWRFDAIRLRVIKSPQSRWPSTPGGAPPSGRTPTAPPFAPPRPDGPPPGCHVPSTSLGPGLDAPASLLALQPSESCFPWMKRRGWACQSRSLIGFAKRRPWLVSRPTVILRCPQLPGAICPPALRLLRGTADCGGAHDVDRPAMRAGSRSSASRPRGNKGPEQAAPSSRRSSVGMPCALDFARARPGRSRVPPSGLRRPRGPGSAPPHSGHWSAETPNKLQWACGRPPD